MNVDQFVKAWVVLLETHKNATNAAAMEAYLKNKFILYGIRSPELRQLSRTFLSSQAKPSYREAIDITEKLWKLPQREHHHFAMKFLERYKKEWDIEFIEIVERLVINQSWWDTVDWIASHLAGGYFQKYPEEIHPICDRWNVSGNMWLIRTTILYQLGYREKVDESNLYKYILPHLDSDEFFIQKAIGWALRNYAKHEPESVLKFVNSNKLKPLSRREALKHIGDKTKLL